MSAALCSLVRRKLDRIEWAEDRRIALRRVLRESEQRLLGQREREQYDRRLEDMGTAKIDTKVLAESAHARFLRNMGMK